MEADLQRYYGIDYRDRWRRDDQGRRVLTLRRIGVLVRNLPLDSAAVRATNDGETPWSIEQTLLADLFHVTAGQAHPLRPKPPEPVERVKARTEAQERLALRRGAVERGLIA